MVTNKYLIDKIGSFLDVSVDTSPTPESCTKLDSYANIVVLGMNSFVFDVVCVRTCDVEPFNTSIGTAKKVQIFDAAVAYTFPYTHEIYVLIARNMLYVPSMDNNIIPTFILQESGVSVCDNPKIH